jgi:hypothetical protein
MLVSDMVLLLVAPRSIARPPGRYARSGADRLCDVAREEDSRTVAEVVRQAAGIVDPADSEALVGELEQWFEDDDDPVRTVPGFDRRLAAAVEHIDPDGEDPAVAVAAAVALYLSTEPRHVPSDAEGVIAQAVRLEYGNDVPAGVAAWLGLQ